MASGGWVFEFIVCVCVFALDGSKLMQWNAMCVLVLNQRSEEESLHFAWSSEQTVIFAASTTTTSSSSTTIKAPFMLLVRASVLVRESAAAAAAADS